MNALSLSPHAAPADAAKAPYFTAAAPPPDATLTIITVAYNPLPGQQQTMSVRNGDLPELSWVIGSMIAQLGMKVPA
jgi:hypothetical protein